MLNDTFIIISMAIGFTLIIVSFIIKEKKYNDEGSNDLNQNLQHINYDAVIKETNQKILELNDYTTFIKEEIENKHKELLFLYQLINEKEKDIRYGLDKINYKEAQSVEEQDICGLEKAYDNEKDHIEISEDTLEKIENKNQLIIDLYNRSYTIIEIAKKLGIGQGEVKLVIDLYK